MPRALYQGLDHEATPVEGSGVLYTLACTHSGPTGDLCPARVGHMQREVHDTYKGSKLVSSPETKTWIAYHFHRELLDFGTLGE